MAPAPRQRPSGTLVVLEGIDGAGKSTVAEALVERLARPGLRVVRTREPTDGPAGRAVRAALKDPQRDPFSEALLFVADHAEHVAWLRGELARPGTLVLSDRYSSSMLAYQGATLATLWPQGGVATADRWLEHLLAPFERDADLTLLLDLPVRDALARLGGRARAPEKFERAELLERVRERYLQLARERAWVIVDARRPTEAIVEQCLAHIERVVGGLGA